MSWNDKRPMSPHLQIYDLPLAAKLSIFHRMTGAVLFMGLILITIMLIILANQTEYWPSIQLFLSSWLAKFIFIGFTFSLYYHLSNGIRHLFWDIGKGFSLEDTKRSNRIVIVSSSLLTLFTWLVPQLI